MFIINKRIKFLRAFIFVILFILNFCIVNRVFVVLYNLGITQMRNYYLQKKDTVDVLFIGTSLAGQIGMDSLWYDYGIAGYCLWGGDAPFWNTYYYLKEALKTQNPKVIVLEVYSALSFYDYQRDEQQFWNTSGMKFNTNFIKSIMVSAPSERYLELLFPIRTFHSRFKELYKNDFIQFKWNKEVKIDKGSLFFYKNDFPMDLTDISNIYEIQNIYPKQEQYLRLIIELCKKKNIELLLLSAPLPNRRQQTPYINKVAEIADEYKILFLNSNRISDKIGFKENDLADGVHINIVGMWKFTSYIGNILKSEFFLPDRRNNKKYSSYEDYFKKTQQFHINGLQANNFNTQAYESEMIRSKYTPFCNFNTPIYFGMENYNAPVYVRCGIAEKNSEFSWTDGKYFRMVCNFPKEASGNYITAKFDLEKVFNDKQQVNVYVNNQIVESIEISNGDDLEFKFFLSQDSITAHIMLEIPGAVTATNDNRKPGIAIKSILFTK